MTGNLIVVSAPSGAGKTSLVKAVLAEDPDLVLSISFTTRSPRPGENNGRDYHFVDPAAFEAMLERGEFLECAEVHGFLYGTHEKPVEELLSQGLDVMLDIDVQGAEEVRRRLPDAILVFIMPPSCEVLEARLRARNLNAPHDIERRLRNASIEVQLYERFDYVVLNEDIDRALAQLEAIITAERCRPDRQRNRIESVIDTFGGEPFHA